MEKACRKYLRLPSLKNENLWQSEFLKGSRLFVCNIFHTNSLNLPKIKLSYKLTVQFQGPQNAKGLFSSGIRTAKFISVYNFSPHVACFVWKPAHFGLQSYATLSSSIPWNVPLVSCIFSVYAQSFGRVYTDKIQWTGGIFHPKALHN